MTPTLVPTVAPRAPMLSTTDAFTQGRAVMLAPDPIAPVEQWATRTTTVIGAAALLWAILRFVFRPLFDDITFAAWRRKRADVERVMRDEIFRVDLERRREQDARLDKALAVADSNATAISHLAADIAKVGAEQRAMTTLLSGIPLLAAGIESVNDTLEHLRADLQANTETTIQHGEDLSAVKALLGADGRRHHTRRAGDPRPPDDDSEVR